MVLVFLYKRVVTNKGKAKRAERAVRKTTFEGVDVLKFNKKCVSSPYKSLLAASLPLLSAWAIRWKVVGTMWISFTVWTIRNSTKFLTQI